MTTAVPNQEEIRLRRQDDALFIEQGFTERDQEVIVHGLTNIRRLIEALERTALELEKDGFE